MTSLTLPTGTGAPMKRSKGDRRCFDKICAAPRHPQSRDTRTILGSGSKTRCQGNKKQTKKKTEGATENGSVPAHRCVKYRVRHPCPLLLARTTPIPPGSIVEESRLAGIRLQPACAHPQPFASSASSLILRNTSSTIGTLPIPRQLNLLPSNRTALTLP